MSTELTVVIPEDKTIRLTLFTETTGLDPLLKQIREKLDAFVPDVTTAKGRDEIKSMAYNVSRSKTLLDSVGEELYKSYKEIPDKIQKSRKSMCTTLDTWRDEVRKPLTDWENADKARKQKHENTISVMKSLTFLTSDKSPEYLQGKITELKALIPQTKEACEEYFDQYQTHASAAHEHLKTILAAAEKRVADAAELARLQEENRRLEEAKKAAEEAQRKAKEEADAAKAREAKAEEERQQLIRDNEMRKQEAEAAKKRADEADAKRKEEQAEFERRRKEEAEAAKKREEEAAAAAKKKAEEDAAAAREAERKEEERIKKELEERDAREAAAHAVILRQLVSTAEDVAKKVGPKVKPEEIAGGIFRAIIDGVIDHLTVEF